MFAEQGKIANDCKLRCAKLILFVRIYWDVEGIGSLLLEIDILRIKEIRFPEIIVE